MQKSLKEYTTTDGDQQTIKWFISLFYIILFSFDFSHFYLLPKFVFHENLSKFGIYNYFVYIIAIALFPLARYLNKINKQQLIKYIYCIIYIIITTSSDILTYYGDSKNYSSGNLVEVFLILYAPLFIDSRFFWLVSIGIILKYALVGIVLESSYVIIPIVLLLILSLMAFILLKRFQGYVNSIKTSYDIQLEEIVKGIIATLELKDPYTRGHSERVAGYALSLAKYVGKFSNEQLKEFNYACLLHDIGKINIPDRILMKPSKLTKEEFDIVKLHPVVGADAIKNVNGLKNNIDVIRSHHERWDGKGYPDQLLGDETPFLARITAVADAFDAMTSSRSYRSELPVEEAYNRIIEGQGTQFDPNLVEAFKKIFPTWVDFHKQYPWTKDGEFFSKEVIK
jgi:HD-GYP domain-containing protein (c-di-GMP phosphodiesterase class II)